MPAIVALVSGSLYGRNGLDPAVGIIGGIVIARWSWGLIRDAGGVLLDHVPADEGLPAEIRGAIEVGGDATIDLHIWRLGQGHHGAIISVQTPDPRPAGFYKAKPADNHDLSHVTVDVQAA